MPDDATHIEEDVFIKVRGAYTPDPVYVERMERELAKCKLNAPVHHQHQPYFGGGRGRGGRDSFHNSRNSHHPTTRKPACIVPCSIMGLLNKVSPKNIDTLGVKIIEAAISQCITTAAAAIIKHSMKQPVYMSVFIRLLGEISASRCGARAQVISAVDFTVQSHIGQPLLQSLPPATSQNDYDGFCTRIKGVKTLMGTVTFVVGCIRAHLCDAIDIDAYATVISDNLFGVSNTTDLETMLEVIETFQGCAAGCEPPEFQRSIATWAETLTDRGMMTARARFKLLDIL